MLFDSLSDPIPSLRYDIEAISFPVDGKDLLLLRDPRGYASETLAFQPEAWGLFLLFDGSRSIQQLQAEIFEATEENIPHEQLLAIIQLLDQSYFLNSKRFHEYREASDNAFRDARVRQSAHAGISYPADANELREFIDGLFRKSSVEIPQEPPIGILAPHIDLRIGGDAYVSAFRSLALAEADIFVILGTAHYACDGLYIPTEKDFETPFGIIKTDQEFVRSILQCGIDGVSTDDLAHQFEHSIEFPVLFLQYLFGNESKKIVPILCTSFDEFLDTNINPLTSRNVISTIEILHRAAQASGKRVAYILSVDWSHIGKKFGDEQSAAQLLEKIRVSDGEQLEAVTTLNYPRFFQILSTTKNETRIDAFACFTTFFGIAQPTHASLLEYHQWHEKERESAVTYASVAFYRSFHHNVDEVAQ